MAGGSTNFVHEPVMVPEIEEVFRSLPPGVVVDATVGGGGHARALLELLPGRGLIGLDQDPAAIAAAATTLAPFGERVRLRQGRFDRLIATLRELDTHEVAGILFDLGVSSPQFDRAERGFSYRHAGPLDMRMDPGRTASAATLVNTLDEVALARLLRRGADERFADRIARAIVAARPIATTTELADVVRDAIPAAARRSGGHPAKRTFQALRIAVNEELDILGPTIDDAIAVLGPGGRLAVLAYHSGEDRIVKERLRHAATGGCTCPPGLPCGCGAVPTVRLLGRGARKPSAAEVARNPRAGSARLRAAEKLAVAA